MQIKICVIVHFNIECVFITVVTRVLNDGKCNPITPSDAKLSGVATLLVGQQFVCSLRLCLSMTLRKALNLKSRPTTSLEFQVGRFFLRVQRCSTFVSYSKADSLRS